MQNIKLEFERDGGMDIEFRKFTDSNRGIMSAIEEIEVIKQKTAIA